MRKEKKNIIKCDLCEGFFIVPGYERYSVNRKGFVFDRELKIPAIISKYKSGDNSHYLHVSGKRYTPVHRLVALTFLDDSHIPKTQKKIVNHLDGDTLDNSVENLEWTTYQGNSIHAYATGLRKDNIPLLCKDIRTGEIKRFYSYWDCARHFDTNGANVFHYLKSIRPNKIFKDYYIIVKEGDIWPIIDINSTYNSSNGLSQKMILISKMTKTRYVTKSITGLCNHIGLSRWYLGNEINKLNMNNRSLELKDWFIIPFSLATEDEKENVIDIVTEKNSSLVSRGKRTPKKIEVQDLQTKEIKLWNSIEEFGETLGVKKNTIQKHILVNSGFFHKKYFIKYLI